MIKAQLDSIVERMAKACALANRNSDDVKLLLATKTQPVAKIQAAIDLGFGMIGENRTHEVTEKFPQLHPADHLIMPYEQHFIGHLQTNKVKDIFPYIQCYQSVDRDSLVKRLHAECENSDVSRDIFVQVNISHEDSKQGLHPDQLFAFLEKLANYPRLNIRGLMTIGLNADDEISVRKGYANLRTLSEEAITKGLMPITATELSMGMSDDLEWAILEGATMIRVGSAVFGARE